MKTCLLSTMPLDKLSGVGTIQTNKLAKIGLRTVQDLLLHFPIRYEDRTNFYQIKDLPSGIYANVAGKVLSCSVNSKGYQMMTCQISDSTGILTARFFNFSKAMKNSLITGRQILLYGKVNRSSSVIEMIHPEYRVQNCLKMLEIQKNLTPIYPSTKGIKQSTLRKLINQALKLLENYWVIELLPSFLAEKMISLPEALHTLHNPPSSLKITDLKSGKHPAQQRLIFEELLAHNLCKLSLKASIQCFRAQPLAAIDDLKNKLLASLPFKPTNAQMRVVVEIERDMALNVPMMRLIQGDVGSGKTLVAALAALRAIAHGKQVALMAPTELLAEQHTKNFSEWFKSLDIKVGWLVGKQTSRERLIQQDAIAKGQIQMIIGTHAILQELVQFNNLALVIMDEQHRFGVHQHLTFWRKGLQHGLYPHQLIMTATPIPRTLAMTTYADLNISIIDELPDGRKPIITVVIPNTRRKEVLDRVQYACTYEGRQAYWVCTIIEASDLLKAQAAEVTWKKLKLIFPKLEIGIIHGRMKPTEKQLVMQKFKQGELHLLVTTTLIEVGVDVPNSSLIIIENSERLGLAQLHQLRGRVGRGSKESYCVMLYKTPLSKIAKMRLQVLRDNNNGFVIAQKDLEIRGPGELLGTRQTGNIKFKIVNLLRDQTFIPEVQHLAQHVYEQYPKQTAELIKRWIPDNISCHNV